MREVRPGVLEEEDPLKDLAGQHLLVVVTDECILKAAAVTFVLQEGGEGSGWMWWWWWVEIEELRERGRRGSWNNKAK